MTSANKIEELEAAMKTMAEAHHTALEVERAKVRELEAQIAMREMLKTAGRQAELDAMQNMLNRNKELEAQLAQWQKLSTDPMATHLNILRGTIKLSREQALHIAAAQDYDDIKAQLAQVQAALFAKLDVERQEQLDRFQGWLSPDEAKALQAQCDNLEKDRTALEKHLEAVCKVIGHSPVSSAPPSETAQELLDRLAKYEKQWSDMNFTICKLEQDLRKAKGEQ